MLDIPDGYYLLSIYDIMLEGDLYIDSNNYQYEDWNTVYGLAGYRPIDWDVLACRKGVKLTKRGNPCHLT